LHQNLNVAMAEVITVYFCLKIGGVEVHDRLTLATNSIVVDLRRAVKLNMAEELTHCSAARLQVFAQGQNIAQGFCQPVYSNTEQTMLTIKAPTKTQGKRTLSLSN
jgi:hypothetical protein